MPPRIFFSSVQFCLLFVQRFYSHLLLLLHLNIWCPRHRCRLSCLSLSRKVIQKFVLFVFETNSLGMKWVALHKLAACCPGLRHSDVLLEHSDFGLECELGPDEIFHCTMCYNAHSVSLKILHKSKKKKIHNPFFQPWIITIQTQNKHKM